MLELLRFKGIDICILYTFYLGSLVDELLSYDRKQKKQDKKKTNKQTNRV